MINLICDCSYWNNLLCFFTLPISHNMLQSKMWKNCDRDCIFCKYVIQICVGIDRILVVFLFYFYTTMYDFYGHIVPEIQLFYSMLCVQKRAYQTGSTHRSSPPYPTASGRRWSPNNSDYNASARGRNSSSNRLSRSESPKSTLSSSQLCLRPYKRRFVEFVWFISPTVVHLFVGC